MFLRKTLLLLALAGNTFLAAAQTFTITKTVDDGTTGTLRHALLNCTNNSLIVGAQGLGKIMLQSPLTLSGKNYITLNNLQIAQQSSSIQTGLTVTNCGNFTVDNCRFYGFALSLKIDQSASPRIVNTKFYDYAQMTAPTLTEAQGRNCGFYASAVTNLTVSNCEFSESVNTLCGTTYIPSNSYLRGAIRLFGVTGGQISSCKFVEQGKYTQNYDRLAIHAEESQSLVITNNNFYPWVVDCDRNPGTVTAITFVGTFNSEISYNYTGSNPGLKPDGVTPYNADNVPINQFLRLLNKGAILSQGNVVKFNQSGVYGSVIYSENCYNGNPVPNSINSNSFSGTQVYQFQTPACNPPSFEQSLLTEWDDDNDQIVGKLPTSFTSGSIWVCTGSLSSIHTGIYTNQFTNQYFRVNVFPHCSDYQYIANYVDPTPRTHNLSNTLTVPLISCNSCPSSIYLQRYIMQTISPTFGDVYAAVVPGQQFSFTVNKTSPNIIAGNNYKVSIQLTGAVNAIGGGPNWLSAEEKIIYTSISGTSLPASITQAMNSFTSLQNVYDKKTFFWRAVLADLTANKTWLSSHSQFTIDPAGGFTLPVDNYIATLNGQPINWEYTVNYSDDGKVAESMTFTDGLDKVRQVQTKNQVENKVLGVETIYSEEGGGTIQTLPAPIGNDGKFGYAVNFFEAQNPEGLTEDYNTRFFDRNQAGPLKKPVTPTPAAATSLLNQYYSNANLGYNENVDNAANYPFNYTVNYQDPTNRVELSPGGFGPEFVLTNRANKHFYDNATQSELDRVFGTGVLKENEIRKNVVYDPNGVGSVTYSDNEGKTIATALQVCPAVANLTPLTVRTNTSQVGEEGLDNFTTELNPLKMDAFKPEDMKRESQASFHVPCTGTELTLNYSVNLNDLTESDGGCKKCKYQLVVKIVGANDGKVYKEVIRSVGGGECTGSNTEVIWTNEKITLDGPAQYYLVREIGTYVDASGNSDIDRFVEDEINSQQAQWETEFTNTYDSYTSWYILRKRRTTSTSAFDITDKDCFTSQSAAGDGVPCHKNKSAELSQFDVPMGVFVNNHNEILVADNDNRVLRIGAANTFSTLAGKPCEVNTQVDGQGQNARFKNPVDVVADANHQYIYVLEKVLPPSNALRRVDYSGNVLTVDLGAANISNAEAITIDKYGHLYIASTGTHNIYKVVPGTTLTAGGLVSSTVMLVAGGSTSGYVNSAGSSARFNEPAGIAADGNGNLYVSDRLNSVVRKITPQYIVSPPSVTYNVTTLAGTAGTSGDNGNSDVTLSAARFDRPGRLLSDPSGRLYVSDVNNNQLRKIDPQLDKVSIVAGNAAVSAGYAEGKREAALLNNPAGLCFAGSPATLYLADAYNNRIRRFEPVECNGGGTGCEATASCTEDVWHIDEVDVTEARDKILNVDGIDCPDPDNPDGAESGTGILQTTVGTIPSVVLTGSATWNDFAEAFERSSWLALDINNLTALEIYPTASPVITSINILKDNKCKLSETGEFILLKATIKQPGCEEKCNFDTHTNHVSNEQYCNELKTGLEAELREAYRDMMRFYPKISYKGTYDFLNKIVDKYYPAPEDLVDLLANTNGVLGSYTPVEENEQANALEIYENYEQARVALESFNLSNCLQQGPNPPSDPCAVCQNEYSECVLDYMTSFLDGYNALMEKWDEVGSFPYPAQGDYFTPDNSFNPAKLIPRNEVIASLGEELFNYLTNNLNITKIRSEWEKTGGACSNCQVSQYCGLLSSAPPALANFPTILMPGLEALNTRGCNPDYQRCAYLKGLATGLNPCQAGIIECENNTTCDCMTGATAMEDFRKFRIRYHIMPHYAEYNPTVDVIAVTNALYTATLALTLEELERYLIQYAFNLECRLECEYEKRLLKEEFFERKRKETEEEARQQYITTCIENLAENFDASYPTRLAHYTLYNYDRAGNLTGTVPPEGIDYTATAQKSHRMKTEVTLNSMYTIKEKTPDAGEQLFLYDYAGRVRFSQNQEQRDRSATLGYLVFSYTKYDSEERITEVGEYLDQDQQFGGWDGVNAACACVLVGVNVSTKVNTADFPAKNDPNAFERTYTVYDLPSLELDGYPQTFLNNRVAAIYNDNGATHYSYDAHGRVNFAVQQVNNLGANRPKITEYRYSPFTGKMLEVIYMKGYPDEEFRHRFTYDAQERITKTEISNDGLTWSDLVAYTYYLHGPVKTKTLGNNIQKIDFIYNINGWLKGINNPRNKADAGMPDDVYAEALHYFSGDYLRTGTFKTDNEPASTTRLRTFGKGLYNGNISSTVHYSAFEKTAMSSTPNMLAEAYQYDWLSRLAATRVETHTQSTFSAYRPSGYANTDYAMGLGYDANGNIMTLTRNGLPYTTLATNLNSGFVNQVNESNEMDNLQYNYNYAPANVPPVLYKTNNQLNFVGDLTANNPDVNDIRPGQATLNYRYDGKGRLIRDLSENINSIEWNVYDKVYRVNRPASMPSLEFGYNGGQQRLYKRSYLPDNEQSTEDLVYIYGADNNLMATYKRAYNPTTLKWETRLEEHLLYGAERIGVYNRNKLVGTTKTFDLPDVKPTLISGLTDLAEDLVEEVDLVRDEVLATAANLAGQVTGSPFLAAVDQLIKDDLVTIVQDLEEKLLATEPPSAADVQQEVSIAIAKIQSGDYAGITERYFTSQLNVESGPLEVNEGIYNRVYLNVGLKLSSQFASAGIDQVVVAQAEDRQIIEMIDALDAEGLSATEMELRLDALKDYMGSQDFAAGLVVVMSGLAGALSDEITEMQNGSSTVDQLVGSLFNPEENIQHYAELIAEAVFADAFVKLNDSEYPIQPGSLLNPDTAQLFAQALEYVRATNALVNTILDMAGTVEGLGPVLQNSSSRIQDKIESWLEDNGFGNPFTPANPVQVSGLHYELTDHLGNVRGVVKGALKNGQADIVSLSDYYPFGQIMPGRNFTSEEYRYGYNGQEKDNEVSGTGTSYTAEYWQYDSRLGRRWNVDPVVKRDLSRYNCFSGNPIWKIDPNGDDDTYYNAKGVKTKTVEKSWFVELFVGDRNYIVGNSGKEYQLTKQGHDVIQGKFGKFTGFVEDWQTTNRSEGFTARTREAVSGYDYTRETKLEYILRESRDITGARMNQKTNLSRTKLYAFNDMAYNSNEAGNVVWGAAMNIFGYDPVMTFLSAHGGTVILAQRLDEPDEAAAAYSGSEYIWHRPGRHARASVIKGLTIPDGP